MCNSYDYPADPIDRTDLSGQRLDPDAHGSIAYIGGGMWAQQGTRNAGTSYSAVAARAPAIALARAEMALAAALLARAAEIAKHDASAALVVGFQTCLLVCDSLGIATDDLGHHHVVTAVGVGAEFGWQFFGSVLAGQKSYMNGGSWNVQCAVDAFGGMTFIAGGGDGEAHPGGGGAGASGGSIAGCSAEHSYMYDAFD